MGDQILESMLMAWLFLATPVLAHHGNVAFGNDELREFACPEGLADAK